MTYILLHPNGRDTWEFDSFWFACELQHIMQLYYEMPLVMNVCQTDR